MAKIKQGILGGFSGSVAGVVGSSWKGIAVMKAKPLSVANPRTAAQTSNRTKFKGAVLAGSKLLTNIVKPLWDRDAQQKSGYNAFIQANKNAFNDSGVLQVADFVPTLGKLEKTDIQALTFLAGNTEVLVGWNNDSGSDEKQATDEAFVIAYNETNGEYASNSVKENRSNMEQTVDFKTPLQSGDVISVWLMFQSADSFRKFSSSSDLSNTVQ